MVLASKQSFSKSRKCHFPASAESGRVEVCRGSDVDHDPVWRWRSPKSWRRHWSRKGPDVGQSAVAPLSERTVITLERTKEGRWFFPSSSRRLEASRAH